jgi:hypothetical protein
MNEHGLALTFDAAMHPNFGMPDERLARVAARRAFVEMKMCFMAAAADLAGPRGESLQRKLRAAADVMDLFRLSPVLLAALPHGTGAGHDHRHEIQARLDATFPEGGGNTRFVPLAI